MITLHLNILERDGKKAFAVLTYEKFQNVREALADYQDLKDLNTAKTTEGAAPTTPLSSVREDLGILTTRTQSDASSQRQTTRMT